MDSTYAFAEGITSPISSLFIRLIGNVKMTHKGIDSRQLQVLRRLPKFGDTARGVLLSCVFAVLGSAFGLGLMHPII